jgi:ABC-type polar amino acid transport system ATPase subunit
MNDHAPAALIHLENPTTVLQTDEMETHALAGVHLDVHKGDLDSKDGEAAIELLGRLHRGGATICMVTHGPRFARHVARTIHLFDGQIVDAEAQAETPASATR